MEGCITENYKSVLRDMLKGEVEHETIERVVNVIPLCPDPDKDKAGVKVAKGERKSAVAWGITPIYTDEKGKEINFSSPTALVRHLGLKISGTQCDDEGKSCRAMSVVEIMRVHGYVVKGNGDEPKKASEGGKTMHVFHPKSPQMKSK